MAKAKLVTDSVAVRGKSNQVIGVGQRHENKWTNKLVIESVQEEKDMTILGINGIDAFDQEEFEVKRYWDDLSGKELDAKLIKEARAEEMREFKKHGAYEKKCEN